MATSKLVLDIIARDQASATLRRLGIAADGSVDKMALLNKASRAAGVGLAAWSAAAVLSVKAAAQESEQQANLARTLEQATGATAEQAASTDDLLTRMGLATGVADDQLRPALSKLAIATGDLSASQDLLGVALDAGVALGKDTETVAVALGKAYNGNVGALGRLGIATKDAEGNSLTFAQVLADLKAKTEGAAEAAGEAAPWKRLQVSVGEAQESIGGALLPIVSKASSVLADMGPGALQAGFAVTGIGLAALTVVPKVIEFKKAIEGVALAEKALALSGKAVGAALIVEGAAFAADKAGVEKWADAYKGGIDIYSAFITKTHQNSFEIEGLISTESTFASVLKVLTVGQVDLNTATDAANTAIAQQDAHFAALVSEGKVSAAGKQYDELKAALDGAGYSTDDLLSLFPKYTDAVTHAAAGTNKARTASELITSALDKQAAATNRATKAWQVYIGLPLDAAAAEMDYQAAVKNTAATIGDETKTRNDKRQAVIDEIRSAEDLREAEISNGESVAAATKKYNDHIARLRQAAEKAGLLRGKTDELAAALQRLPSNIRIGVQLTMDTSHDEVVISTAAGNRRVLDASLLGAGGFAHAASGRYVVGEYGPEVLTMTSGGGRVHPHSQSLRGLAGGDVYITVAGDTDPVGAARRIAERLRELKRVQGGAALGIA